MTLTPERRPTVLRLTPFQPAGTMAGMDFKAAFLFCLFASLCAACGPGNTGGSAGSGAASGSGGTGGGGEGGTAGGAPELPGFFAGGIAGFECPPASEPQGSCNEPDCGVACVANTTCAPSQAECPLGYFCSEASDPAYCLPETICDSSAACGGDYCAKGGIAQGICVPVDPTPFTCDANGTCPWPFWCTNGQCELFCAQDECPTGTACVDYRCAAM